MIDVSIIIVSWNVADLLADCIDSILASPISINEPDGDLPVVEIIVVDSASSDDSVAMIRERYPEVRLFAEEENVGFVQGNNIGFAAAQGRYHFLLNPDTVLHDDAINKMVEYLDKHPEVGIVGPHTLNTDGSHQSTRRRFPSVPIAFFESTWIEKYAPDGMLDTFYMRDMPNDETYEVDWVQGSALVARAKVYDQIGGLDTVFFMYFEETDWCKRAKAVGWRVVYLGDIYITHHGGKSSAQVTAFQQQQFQSSKLRYYHKHYGRPISEILRVYLILHYVWQIVMESAKALLGSKREMRRKRIQVYSEVLRQGLRVS